jgi:uncharacterized protein DUF6968
MLFREFFGPNGTRIRINVSNVIKDDSSGDWKCEYWIEGLGSTGKKVSYGIDPIQAIYLALTYLSTKLYCSDEFKLGLITWGGGENEFDLGLPIARTIQEDVRGRIHSLGRGTPA